MTCILNLKFIKIRIFALHIVNNSRTESGRVLTAGREFSVPVLTITDCLRGAEAFVKS
jgi:hypothetical protein